ncbi:Uncharacterized protein TCM_045121 [Theobroma cacao]|uniref:Uncharacterized protein n=1 Tax=Theobroma cacao TaxID=3641 RepID=A0A061FSB6_THECC|nr:Uncharacterized protein TCM_045121 [Theobroma cacao]
MTLSVNYGRVQMHCTKMSAGCFRGTNGHLPTPLRVAIKLAFCSLGGEGGFERNPKRVKKQVEGKNVEEKTLETKNP